MNKLFKLLFLLLTLFPTTLRTQSNLNLHRQESSLSKRITESFICSGDTVYQLTHFPILENSDTIRLNWVLLLQKGEDYTINYETGKIHFALNEKLQGTYGDTLEITITYRSLRFSLKNEYRLFETVPQKTSQEREQQIVVPIKSQDLFAGIFNPSLEKSGSLFRGITVGTNRDLTLNSGFRMQMSGNLSEDVTVIAALTDENSPIQPEGTTQQLQELDKVFIQLQGRQYGLTLGDFDFDSRQKHQSEFVRLRRKLQGVQGEFRSKSGIGPMKEGKASLVIGSPRGMYNSNYFQGVEANQGPYRLTGKNGERRIIIIAGTERVYFNGELMTRGETNDYTIDYSGAEIYFMNRRLITNASRITVDFEYTDRRYERNFVSGSADVSMMNGRVNLNASVSRETDNIDSPIDFDLDDEAKRKLQESGGDRLRASLSGIIFVGRDSTTNIGRGQYALRDTLIGNSKFTKAVYIPGAPEAEYSVSFAYFERIPSDSLGYRKVKLGHYEVAGLGKGNYLPLKLIPIPQKHDVANILISGSPNNEVSVHGEIAFSDLDRNRFSTLDNSQNRGVAYSIKATYNPKEITLADKSLGEFDIRLSQKYVENQFFSPDRFREIEFDRKWDIQTEQLGNEIEWEGSLRYKPTHFAEMSFIYGQLERGGNFRSNRNSAEVMISDTAIRSVRYQYEQIVSRNTILNSESEWNRQRATLFHHVWILMPKVLIDYEDRSRRQENTSGSVNGFRFWEITPIIETQQIGKLLFSTEFQFRKEDSTTVTGRAPVFEALTQKYSLGLRDWKNLTSNISIAHRKLEYSESYRSKGYQDSDHLLVRLENRFSSLRRSVRFDTFYEFAKQRSAKFERVYIKVPVGSGNYIYKRDINQNGIADDEEFELSRFDGDYIVILLPGDQLIPIVDLKASLRLRLQPSEFFTDKSTTFASVLSTLSTETYLRVDERNSDTQSDNIIFLRFRRFQNEKNTLSGFSILTQDIHLYENDPGFSLRLRYNQRTGIIQLANGFERSKIVEKSARLRWQLIPEIGNQTDIVNKLDRVSALTKSHRERDIIGNSVATDFYYRPSRQWEVGFKLGISRSVDSFENSNVIADLNSQGVRIIYAFLGMGQLRAEFDREEVQITNKYGDQKRTLPFELTLGRRIGKSYLLQVNFDYRISQNLQLTMNYFGRYEGMRQIHTARGEARAFF